jgi:adenylate kinase family enzyme
MIESVPRKIHIIGSVGSGKTTLARKLSLKLNIPFYELDNVVWARHPSGDIRRTEAGRDEYLETIIQSESWIVEGVHNEDWVASSFENADLIIFLDPRYSVRTYRIIKRFIMQKLGIEQANYDPSFEIFKKMFKWNRHFEEVGKPNFFEKYGGHRDKIVVVTKKFDIEEHI